MAGVAAFVQLREARWNSALYCIERRGELWAGLGGTLPAAFEPACPASNSMRREVRAGDVRVEQYTTPGWQPRAIEDRMRARGFAVLDAEFLNPKLYEAFLGRGGEKIYYLASRQDGFTSFTLNGRPIPETP